MSLDLRLTVEESGRAKPDRSRASGRVYETRVQLRPGWIRYGDGASGRDVVVDFARRRRLQIDTAARTFVDLSLYAVVASRAIELPNRAHIRSVLEAGRANPSQMTNFDPVVSEHMLSVLSDEQRRTIRDLDAAARSGIRARLRARLGGKARADIQSERDGGQIVHSATVAGRRLLSYAVDGVHVEPAMVRCFTRFLRYAWGGHPLILDRIAAGGRIPREIRWSALRLEGSPGDEVALRVDAVDAAAESQLDLEGHQRSLRVADAAKEFGPALEKAIVGESPDADEVTRRRKAEAREAMEGGRQLEFALSLFELTLQTADPLPDLGAFLGYEPDVNVVRLLGMLNAASADDTGKREAINTLVDLRELAGKHRHVLLAFEAAQRAYLGERTKAIELFAEVLAVNPFLTVAYIDLGNCFFSSFDTETAWLCWDAARRIAPHHPVLQQIDQLEAGLAKAHPEYF
jgi:tetratricopeptide (TPR) repeat protein